MEVQCGNNVNSILSRHKNIVNYPVEFGFRIFGAWPDMRYGSCCRFLWLLSMSVSQVFHYRYVIWFGSKDFLSLTESFSVAVGYTLIFMRTIVIWLKMGLLKEILNAMAEDWQSSCIAARWQTDTMSSKALLSSKLSKSIIGLYMASMAIFNCSLLIPRYTYYNDNSTAVEGMTLMQKIIFPFESDSLSTDLILSVLQLLNHVATVIPTAATNGLLITSVLHVDGQIDIICRALLEYTVDNGKLGTSNAGLKTLICRHNRVIVVSDNIENLFTYVTLIAFLIVTVIMACAGFVVIVSTQDAITQMIFAAYYVCILTDLFIYCCIGDHLKEKSMSISYAVYESVWYERKPAECRLLLLMMMRSQRRLTLTAGKFIDLTLEQFTTVVKASMSYMSLFSALYL